MEKYSDELLNMEFSVEMLDGIKPERAFFAITEDTLRNLYHVLPTDSLEEARKKIMDVVSKDDFLYEYFHKDPRSWEIRSFEPGYWTTPAKEEKILSREELEDLGYEEDKINKMRLPVKNVSVIQTYQQKLTVRFAKRNPVNAFSDEKFFELYEKEFENFLTQENVYMEILKNKFADVSPKRKKKDEEVVYDSSKLLVIPDVELHLGKLASKFDSTDSYDYKKALYRYTRIICHVEELQDKVKAERILLTIGNDFYNTDTEQNTTTAGTIQHNDTRFQQMLYSGAVAHVWAIERLKQKCDKLVIKINPGNHDYLVAQALYMQLYMTYRNDPKVEISGSVKDSRWVTCYIFGRNLLMFGHGKTPEGRALNDNDLSLVKDTMFQEEAKLVDNSYFHAGHFHEASMKRAKNGVFILRNGSTTGTGAWDSGNLYSADKSHQAYIYDYERGLYSLVNIRLTKEELEKSISIPSITEDTEYIEEVEKSIDLEANNIIRDDAKKVEKRIEKNIKSIDKKYTDRFKKLVSILDNPELTNEQKKQIYEVLGYNEEVEPFMQRKKELYDGLSSVEKKLTLTK